SCPAGATPPDRRTVHPASTSRGRGAPPAGGRRPRLPPRPRGTACGPGGMQAPWSFSRAVAHKLYEWRSGPAILVNDRIEFVGIPRYRMLVERVSQVAAGRISPRTAQPPPAAAPTAAAKPAAPPRPT